MNLLSYIFIFIISFYVNKLETGKSSKNVLFNVPFWQEIDSWSQCSTSCGDGFEEKNIKCFRQTFYLTENISPEKCSDAKKPRPKTKRCNYGNCDQSYVWKINELGKCSHTCGYAGVQMNEVECFAKSGSDTYTATDPERCIESKKPINLRSCNRFNCPVLFQVNEWGNCIKSNECSPGKQRRNLTCLSRLSSGKILYLPRAACYQMGIAPPASWRKCFDHIDEEKCFQKKKKELEPEIIVSKHSLVQMRRVNKLNLQVGNIAYIIPGTKLIVTCPVKNYLQINLVWSFKDAIYSYKGKSKNRIKVNKKGRLTIGTFSIQDQGIWICQAGNVTASLVVKLKSPSDGFKDWAIRNTIWNKEMPNEDSQMDMMNHEIVRWVTGSWSRCTISCGGIGTQSRFVRCEKLENRYYYKLDDSYCLKQVKIKPKTVRECFQLSKCPRWTLSNEDKKLCTDKCITFGKGTVLGDIKCLYENKTVDEENCDPTTKPFQECDNPQCTVKWKISSWTKCSRSCGDQGIQARYLMCVWNNTDEFAGSLCYKAKLLVPRVIKTCTPPKCNLECVDLFKDCKRKQHYCKFGMYQFQCCKTCHKYFQSLRKKTG